MIIRVAYQECIQIKIVGGKVWVYVKCRFNIYLDKVPSSAHGIISCKLNEK